MIVRGRHRRHRVRRRATSSALLVAFVLLTVPAAGALTADTTGPSDRIESGSVPALVEPRAATEPLGLESTEPVGQDRILIEAIGVVADVEVVGLAEDGTLGLPTDVANVGWFAGSSRPGDMGPAVMVGHLDSVDGPAVFAQLAEVHVGDVVTVQNGGGTTHSFTVSTVTRHSKQSFPTQTVYGPTPDAELHLITCGGRYDRDTGYVDNIVVIARAPDQTRSG